MRCLPCWLRQHAAQLTLRKARLARLWWRPWPLRLAPLGTARPPPAQTAPPGQIGGMWKGETVRAVAVDGIIACGPRGGMEVSVGALQRKL